MRRPAPERSSSSIAASSAGASRVPPFGLASPFPRERRVPSRPGRAESGRAAPRRKPPAPANRAGRGCSRSRAPRAGQAGSGRRPGPGPCCPTCPRRTRCSRADRAPPVPTIQAEPTRAPIRRYPPRANDRSPPSTINPRPRFCTAATSAFQKRGLASVIATSSSTTAW